ncbi:MAG: flagellar basal body L-ring protein FlgH [Planctomycetota bacterium]
MSVTTICLAAACAVLAAGPAARADSIWDKRTTSGAFLFTDNLAAEIGDSLTVLIADQSSFTKEDERELEKTTRSSGSANISTAIVDLSIPAGDLETSSTREFEGTNDYTSVRSFADSVTVTVVDKLPNGNLVVAGRSERHISGEDLVTMLTGIVKPEDISQSNTVSSTRVAQLRIFYDTDDPTDAFVEQGILGRIFNILWPF